MAAISGISNLIRFLNSEKWREYAFIEVMTCPGGCINGGGTPKVMKRPNIQENFCISCGTCIENCPVRALEFNANGVATVDKNKCVGCTLCSNLCRSNAISTDYYDKSNGTILKESYIALRKSVLENIDKESTIRLSNENPALNEMYKTYFGVYGSPKAKELLHTKYKAQSNKYTKGGQCHRPACLTIWSNTASVTPYVPRYTRHSFLVLLTPKAGRAKYSRHHWSVIYFQVPNSL